MSYDKVTQAKDRLLIGLKQTEKAMKAGQVSQIVIASDIDSAMRLKLVNLANELMIPYEMVDSNKRLGKACGIEVGTAVVAIRQ
ncbi:ribosomal L7Ae/L30e/S12e/Gadd45 family protein [Amphibacillus indicireducens]|uniref:50S ribosomal protein L7ae-like protein n=1 Tax=Amphibacillus indicireducens TaxID=1076330 RepID=A0ABP7VFS8_9BACI